MPQEIRDAIQKARGDGDGNLEDEEYRKRLQDKFGNRWLTTQLVQAREGETKARAATPTNETAEWSERRGVSRTARKKRKRARRIQVIRLRANEGGNGQGVERQVAVDVPKFRYVDKDQFDEDWHLASWVPNDPEGPTVLMNREAPILLRRSSTTSSNTRCLRGGGGEEVVKDTYGEVAVCKIAHSQKLIVHVAEEDLDHDLSQRGRSHGLAYGPSGGGEPDRATSWQAWPQEECGLAHQLLHHDPVALNVVQLELDRGGCLGRLRVGGLDRPQNFALGAQQHGRAYERPNRLEEMRAASATAPAPARMRGKPNAKRLRASSHCLRPMTHSRRNSPPRRHGCAALGAGCARRGEITMTKATAWIGIAIRHLSCSTSERERRSAPIKLPFFNWSSSSYALP